MGAFEVGTHRQGWTNALARKLQQTKLRDFAEGDAGFIVFDAVAQGVFNFTNLFLVAHIDEIDDDQPAQIAQAQLATNFSCRFNVAARGRSFNAFFTAHAPRIDINGHQGLCLINHNGATCGQKHLVMGQSLNLLFNLIAGKDGAFFAVEFDQPQKLGHDQGKKIARLLVNLLIINQNFVDITGKVIANTADNDVRFLVELRRGLDLVAAGKDAFVETDQIIEVAFEFALFLTDPGRAHDVAHFLGQIELGHGFLQGFALFVILNLARNALGVAVGHQHHIAAGQREQGG